VILEKMDNCINVSFLDLSLVRKEVFREKSGKKKRKHTFLKEICEKTIT